MDKLFEILAQGEMPDFFQMLQALNEISDIDWKALEASQFSLRDVFKDKCIPNYPVFCSGEFCDACG